MEILTNIHTKPKALSKILRVPDQNGVSLVYIMLEIHHSGLEPSNHVSFGATDYLISKEIIKLLTWEAELA